MLMNEEVKTKRLYGGSQAKGWKNNFCGVEVIDLEHEVDPGLTGFKDGFAFRQWGSSIYRKESVTTQKV